MFLTMLRAKIHRATVTETNISYAGSITIDEAVLEAVGIFPGERVQVVNNNNGARFETYVISGSRGTGIVCINGAAARLAQPQDTVIIIAYALVGIQDASDFRPRIVVVNGLNEVIEVKQEETHGAT